jgi:hypothetical protein
MHRAAGLAWVAVSCVSISISSAETTVFFEACQTYTVVETGMTWDVIDSNGYRFRYTRDKLFTGGTGQPIGRPVRIPWPQGVEAQAVTTPPPGEKARIELQRVDGQAFDLAAFTFKLLANTYGAGASLEIMPLLNGEDAFDEPVFFEASGFYGQTFSYDTWPNPWGSTALLVGFDTYKITLYVDFAFMALTLSSASPDPQSCCMPDDSCADLTSDACSGQGGVPLGAGTSCGCDPCIVVSGPRPVPDGRLGTSPVRASRLTIDGDSMRVTWDVASCPASGVNLVHGDLGAVASYTLFGAVCDLGASGDFVWLAVPDGDLYFLLVGTDGAATESSWGIDGTGQERNASVPSGFCGVTIKDPSGTCP